MCTARFCGPGGIWSQRGYLVPEGGIWSHWEAPSPGEQTDTCKNITAVLNSSSKNSKNGERIDLSVTTGARQYCVLKETFVPSTSVADLHCSNEPSHWKFSSRIPDPGLPTESTTESNRTLK